jgi:hypothetical protein
MTETDWTDMNRAMAAADARKAAGLAEVTASAVDRSRAILAQVESLGRGGRTAVGRHLGISDTSVGRHLAQARDERTRGEQPRAEPAVLTLPMFNIFGVIADHETNIERADLSDEDKDNARDEISRLWGAISDAAAILAECSLGKAHELLATAKAEKGDGERDEHGSKVDPKADHRENQLYRTARALLAAHRDLLDRTAWASAKYTEHHPDR